MRYLLALSLAIAGASLVECAASSRSRTAVISPNRYIIELKDPEGLVKRSDDDGQKHVDDLFAALDNLNITTSSPLNFTSEFLVGTSVTISNDTDMEILKSLTQIEKIWPVFEIPLPEPIDVKTGLEPPQNYNVHVQTGVQRLHDEGNYGKGVLIAIIDSGVDYTHSDLGGGYGPGFKIEGGRDYVGDKSEISPDNDPMDDCQGHGTHVTGIIAGNGTRFTGVAPGASIRVYKVSGCSIQAISFDNLIAAHIQAYKDGADIISTSVGDESGWPSHLWAITSSKIAKKGVFVVSAAGNSGASGPFVISGEATGQEVIAVASSHASEIPGLEATVTYDDGSESKIGYLVRSGLPLKEDYPPGRGIITPLRSGVKLWSAYSPENTDPTNLDGCEDASVNDTKELAGRVVLIRESGNCSIIQAARAAVQRGAYNVLIINNRTIPWIPITDFDSPRVQFAVVNSEVGSALERRLIKNETVTITIPESSPIIGLTNMLAGAVDTYSSWGLANDFSVKPDISAPGSEIYSTYPRALGSYSIQSGTSMATPYISGVIALYLSANGGGRAKKGASELRRISRSLLNRGNPAPWLDANKNMDITTYAPVAQQGGGFINAYKFVHSSVQFSPEVLALNHTGNFQGKFRITVTNTGSQPLNLNVTHQPGATFYTYNKEYFYINTVYPTEIIKDKVATANLSTSYLQLEAGENKDVDVEFTAPTGFDEPRLPIYGGYIAFTDSDNDAFYVPYSGVATDAAASLKTPDARADFWQGSTLANIRTPMQLNLTYDGVIAEFTLHYGARMATVELYQNSTFTTTSGLPVSGIPGVNGFVGLLYTSYNLGRSTIQKAPERLITRSLFSNGTAIPQGVYRYVVRGLQPFVDPLKVESWWAVASPTITVVT